MRISSAIRSRSKSHPSYSYCEALIVARQFFSGPLKQFERTRTWTSASGKKMTGLVNADIIDAIGEGLFPNIAFRLP